MSFLSKHRLFLSLSLVIALTITALVSVAHYFAHQQLHQDEQEQAVDYLSAFHIAYNATQDNMLQIANIVANTPRYQTLFLEGKRAVKSEGGGAGGEQSELIRKELYKVTSENWLQFSDKFHARQLHFHLGPGSTSFLRVHRSEKFGDNMDSVRYTIVDTNKLQKPVSGFETGRVYSGIRGTSPVSIINAEGEKEHIGAVEAGVSFDPVFENLLQQFDINAAVLLSKEHLQTNVWPDFFKELTQKKPLHNGLYIESTTSEQINDLVGLTTSHFHNDVLETNISVKIFQLGEAYYLYASQPLRDYRGTLNSELADVGNIVIWKDITPINAAFIAQTKINIYSAIAAFFIVEILLLLAIRTVSSRLNKVINNQTIEISSTNLVLEQLIQDKSLSHILTTIVKHVEKQHPEMLCSILLISLDGKYLLTGAAPSLPEFYNKAVHGINVGNYIGSCGTAAFTKKRVVVEDVQSHACWTEFKDLAAQANLHACWSEPILGNNNKVLGTFAIYHRHISAPSKADIKLIEDAAQLTALAIERKLADDEHQLASRVFNAAHEGITVTDTEGRIIDVNPTFCKITGYSREEVLGKNPSMLSSGRQGPEFYEEMWRTIKEVGHWQGEVWNRHKNGQLYAELLTLSSLLDENGKPRHYVGLFSDITQMKEQQKSLELMAHYDVLTQLPNRALFSDRFKRAISHSKRSKTLLAICFLDLDHFKPVNDNFGHDIGDKLLIEVADRIKAVIREEDTVSRQGGDEFALLLADIESTAQCENLLDRLHHALAMPYIIDGISHNISASSGTTLYPVDNADIDTLVRHADQAMYQAKLAGRNTYHLFNASDNEKISQQHIKLQEIQSALVNGELCLYYQPKVNMKSGKVFGAEALIRWIHPEKGLIPPLQFLPIIEGSPLEIEIGRWVINEALTQLHFWLKQDIKLEVSVNISSYHLQSPTFFSDLENALSLYPEVDSSYFQLEILESSALGDVNTISKIIKSCQDGLGINVALDDFGTGYSSLTHLRNLTANTIKIDQSFVRDILDDPNDYAIINGVIGLSEAFNRQVIAEGVETTEHGLILLLMGCIAAQGYGISRPMPSDDIPEWLANYTPKQEWIKYANQPHSLKESKIKLLRLTTQYWFDKLLENISTAHNEDKQSWPIINHTQCHHGAWIQRIKKEHIFDESWLSTLSHSHEEMHRYAGSIITKHTENSSLITQEDMAMLQAKFDDVMLILGQYE